MMKKEITVVCNYPTPENMQEFQKRYCDAMVNALKGSLTPEEMELRRKGVEELLRREKREKGL